MTDTQTVAPPANSGQAATPPQSNASESGSAPRPNVQVPTSELGATIQGRGQARIPMAGTSEQTPGQGATPPEPSVPASAAKEEAAPAVPPVPAVEAPKWDPATESWMKSKGWDVSKFSPAEESHKKLIEAQRNMEAAYTRSQQEAKARETLERSKTVVPPPGQATAEGAPKGPQSPIEEFEAVHAWLLQDRLKTFGLQSIEQLAQIDPAAAQRIKDDYLVGRQKAWEESQKWERDQAEERRKKADEEMRFATDLRNLEQLTDQNLNAYRAKNPKIDEVLKASGVEKVFEFFDKQHTLPRSFILHNPEVAQWFIDAADAIDYRAREGEREVAWKAKYEADLAKAKSAQLPPIAGSDTSAAGFSSVRPAGGWLNTLESTIKK